MANNQQQKPQQQQGQKVVLMVFPNEGNGPKVPVEFTREEAAVSPVLKALLGGGQAQGQQGQAGQGQAGKAADNSSPPHMTSAGVELLNPACKEEVIKKIKEWCDYHTTDEVFKATCTFDDFDEDEYEREQQRITEVPCYFDWDFITKVGDGMTNDIRSEATDKNRTKFYNTMIAANYLGLDDLVLLGGKFICKQISGKKDIDYVRNLLGIVNDLGPKAEEIRQANERILGKGQ